MKPVRPPSTCLPRDGTEAKSAFGTEHAWRLKRVSDAGLLGDGRRGFTLVAEIVGRRHETHSLWLFDRDGSDGYRIAGDLGDVRAPSPSPDGRSVAVLAEVGGVYQICLIPIADGVDGRARPLTRLPQGVAVSGRPMWAPDGRSIAFTAGPAERRDPSLPYRVDRATYRVDGLGYLDDVVTDVYVVDVTSGSTRRYTGDRAMNSHPRWSPDGRTLSYLVSFPPDRAWDFLPELHACDVDTGESRVLVSGWGGVFSAEWCGDGERIVFVGCRAAGGLFAARKLDLWTVAVAGGDPVCRTHGLTTGVGWTILTDLPVCDAPDSPRIRVRDDSAYVGGQVGGDAVIHRVRLSGPEAVERAVDAEGSAYLVDVDPHGDVLSLVTSFADPPELMFGPTRVTALNDDLIGGLERPRVRRLAVTASDGLRTDAWALTPPRGRGPWPTVLCVHGGPYGAFGSTYVIDFQLLVGAGFAVVFHNFRGSYGYGTEFSQKIVGAWGPAGALDHHATVDEAVRAGIADPDRLGVFGLSHGGFATCWLVGTSDRFKAAVAENPVTGFASLYGAVDAHAWIADELGGTPHEVPQTYRSRSPLTFARNCTTPLLFIVGEEDLRCPPSESEQYYRILKSNDVPTEMLRLPNSAHTGTVDGPVPARLAQNEAVVAWFTRYLSPANPRK